MEKLEDGAPLHRLWIFLNGNLQGMVVEASVPGGFVEMYTTIGNPRDLSPDNLVRVRREGEVKILYLGRYASYVKHEDHGPVLIEFIPEN